MLTQPQQIDEIMPPTNAELPKIEVSLSSKDKKKWKKNIEIKFSLRGKFIKIWFFVSRRQLQNERIAETQKPWMVRGPDASGLSSPFNNSKVDENHPTEAPHESYKKNRKNRKMASRTIWNSNFINMKIEEIRLNVMTWWRKKIVQARDEGKKIAEFLVFQVPSQPWTKMIDHKTCLTSSPSCMVGCADILISQCDTPKLIFT